MKSPSHAGPLIVSDITNPFFAEIIPAIEERLGRSHLYSGKDRVSTFERDLIADQRTHHETKNL